MSAPAEMKIKYAMVIDSSRCMDCKACIISCQMENRVPPGLQRNWIKRGTWDTGAGIHYQPGNCMHCDRPTCVEACPTGATYKDEQDGTVRVNTRLCIGCGSCIPACPYGARFRHPQTRIVDKCDYCMSRRALGREPACVETCPTRARVFGNISDPGSEAAQLMKHKKTVRIFNPKTPTEPAIYYVGATSPTDWPAPADPPEAIRLWREIVNPVVKGIVGLSGIGVVVMLAKQVFLPEKPSADSHDSDQGER